MKTAYLSAMLGVVLAGLPTATLAAAPDPTGGKFTIEEAVKGLPGKGTLTANIETSMGTFHCELFEQNAPNTVANFVGLAAARGELLHRQGWNVEDDGLYGAPPLRVLIGADAHNTVFSGLRYLGLGEKRVTTVATDDLGRMLPAALEAALKADKAPAIVIGQAGQINTGVSDPFSLIAPLIHAHGGWLHVDGAFGLWARASTRHAHLLDGIEQADSMATDGHKWLQTPYDCGFAICRHEAAHRRAMEMTASYLTPDDPSFRHPGDYVPELSRRARGFAAWAMMRRRFEMYEFREIRAAAGGSSSQIAVIRSAALTARLGLVISIASTARCLGVPTGIGVESMLICSGPSTPNCISCSVPIIRSPPGRT